MLWFLMLAVSGDDRVLSAAVEIAAEVKRKCSFPVIDEIF